MFFYHNQEIFIFLTILFFTLVNIFFFSFIAFCFPILCLFCFSSPSSLFSFSELRRNSPGLFDEHRQDTTWSPTMPFLVFYSLLLGLVRFYRMKSYDLFSFSFVGCLLSDQGILISGCLIVQLSSLSLKKKIKTRIVDKLIIKFWIY